MSHARGQPDGVFDQGNDWQSINHEDLIPKSYFTCVSQEVGGSSRILIAHTRQALGIYLHIKSFTIPTLFP